MIVKLLTDFTVFLVLYYLCHGEKMQDARKKFQIMVLLFTKTRLIKCHIQFYITISNEDFFFFFKVQGIQHSKFHILNLNAKFFLSSRSKLSKIIGPGPTSNLVVSYGLIHVYAVSTLYYYTLYIPSKFRERKTKILSFPFL